MGDAMPKRKSWRDVLPIHEAANLFPPLGEAELQALTDDIRNNGLQEPVTLWAEESGKKFQRYVLDGRGRLDAMERIGITILDSCGNLRDDIGLQPWKSPLRYSVREVYGRQLSTTVAIGPGMPRTTQMENAVDPFTYVVSANIRRRQLTSDQIASILREIDKRRPGMTTRQAAKVLNISNATVSRLRQANPSVTSVTQGADNRTGRLQISREKAIKLSAALRDNSSMSSAAIAELVGVSKSTVQKARKRENAPREKATPPKVTAPQDTARVLKILREYRECSAEEKTRVYELLTNERNSK